MKVEKTAICLLKDHDVLRQKTAEIQKKARLAAEMVAAKQKEAEELLKASQAEAKAIWGEIEGIVKESICSEYDRGRDGLSFSDGVLYWKKNEMICNDEKKGGEELSAFLKSLKEFIED